jgi:hypothetical protein
MMLDETASADAWHDHACACLRAARGDTFGYSAVSATHHHAADREQLLGVVADVMLAV